MKALVTFVRTEDEEAIPAHVAQLNNMVGQFRKCGSPKQASKLKSFLFRELLNHWEKTFEGQVVKWGENALTTENTKTALSWNQFLKHWDGTVFLPKRIKEEWEVRI